MQLRGIFFQKKLHITYEKRNTLCLAGCGWWLELIYCEKKVLLADCDW